VTEYTRGCRVRSETFGRGTFDTYEYHPVAWRERVSGPWCLVLWDEHGLRLTRVADIEEVGER
jgi:hypothetical protein